MLFLDIYFTYIEEIIKMYKRRNSVKERHQLPQVCRINEELNEICVYFCKYI